MLLQNQSKLFSAKNDLSGISLKTKWKVWAKKEVATKRDLSFAVMSNMQVSLAILLSGKDYIVFVLQT